MRIITAVKKAAENGNFLTPPKQWTIQYKNLTFNLKPFSFKHTGLFPEQAANWDWLSKNQNAGRPIKVLNLLPTGGQLCCCYCRWACVTMWMLQRAWSPGQKKMPFLPDSAMHQSAGWLMTESNL